MSLLEDAKRLLVDNPAIGLKYELAIRLGKLPYEWSRDGAPQHQILMGIAYLQLEREARTKAHRQIRRDASTPPKWRKIHARVDAAAAALARMG